MRRSDLTSLEAGIIAAILRMADDDDLPLSVSQVNAISREIARSVVGALFTARSGRPSSENLTDRDRRTLYFLANGLDSYEAAAAAGIPRQTEKSRRKALYARIGARNGSHAVGIAAVLGELPAIRTLHEVMEMAKGVSAVRS